MTQTALILGASRGLGLGLVREYLARGWAVIATARGPSALDALAGESQGRLRVDTLDVTDDAGIAALQQAIAGQRLDLVFANAGIAPDVYAPLGSLSAEAFSHIMVTNTLAPMRLLETFAGQVDPQGVMAVMSSGLGSIATADSGGWEVYRASKAALNMAIRSFALRHKGTTVLTLSPGWVKTDMGGPGASLDVATSVRGLADVIAAQAGRGGHAFLDYRGQTVPW